MDCGDSTKATLMDVAMSIDRHRNPDMGHRLSIWDGCLHGRRCDFGARAEQCSVYSLFGGTVSVLAVSHDTDGQVVVVVGQLQFVKMKEEPAYTWKMLTVLNAPFT